jgi:hypothetical protein
MAKTDLGQHPDSTSSLKIQRENFASAVTGQSASVPAIESSITTENVHGHTGTTTKSRLLFEAS